MSTKEKASGWLGNAFSDPRWNSRITSANTTRKEMWLGYVIGPFGMLMAQSIVNSYFNRYLTDVLGFTVSKGAWIATFMVLFPVISKLIGAVTNLVMSKIIDSTVCRQGKARPWMLISAPIVTISIFLLFYMPFTNVYAQAVWVIVTYNLYYSVAYTIWNMSKELSAAVSTRNMNQRKNNAMALQITANIGTGLISILFPTILTAVCAAMNGNNAQGYFVCMGMIGIIALPLTLVQYFYTRERVTEERHNQVGMAKEDAKRLEVHGEASLWSQLGACLKSKYWLVFMVVVLVAQVLANMRNISLVYYSGWVVQGNAYGEYATIQARFQMIAMSPMGPGVLLILPLVKKFGRQATIAWTSLLTIVGSIIAYVNAGSSMMIYVGSALAAFGCVGYTYLFATFLGDLIDHVEYQTGVRCDGITSGVYGAVFMLSVGIAQGIFNLGLMISNYAQPEAIGVSADGITLYADQTAAATGWINFAYQGSYIILGVLVFLVYFRFFDIEKHMPAVSKELENRKIAECAAQGIDYVPASELERREIEQQEAEAEANRIAELKEYCAKRGLDFDVENQKVLDKQAKKAAKAAAKAAKKAKK